MASIGTRSSSSTWIFSFKAVLASAGVLSTAVILHMSGPSILGFLSSEVPRIYASLLSWLTPPYLYFVINGIIISIAASSRFQKSSSGNPDLAGSIPPVVNPPVIRQEFVPPTECEAKVEEVEPPEFVAQEYGKVDPVGWEEVEVKPEDGMEGEQDFVISRSSWSPKRRESRGVPSEYSLVAAEKPLVSARLGRRKSLKASPEGKALRVSRPKRNETLESTWKTITDGRPVPLARHLKKCDTWELHGHGREDQPDAAMRKSETFQDRVVRPLASSSPSPSSGGSSAGKLRKEPSLGQDDLNRRVEAFIKKFNEEMRLQRQESLMHYMDMINRGSH